MKNAVIYARYSSDRQNEMSIEGQLAECRKYAEEHEMFIVREYVDRALTATSDKRPSFLQMIKDSDDHTFEVVLVYQLDRFSRNMNQSGYYKTILENNGVQVVSAKEFISSDSSGAITEGVLMAVNEWFSRQLSEKVSRGMYQNAAQFKYNGGALTFGYAIDADRHYVLDPKTAPLVKEAFERTAEGETSKAIMDDFNSRGIKTTRGRSFTKNSLQNILRNERYKGTYIFGEARYPNAIPRIVSDELFEEVQEVLAMRGRGHRKGKKEYLLTGKLYCGHCNTKMVGTSGTSRNGDTHRYYFCPNAPVKCDKKNPKKEEIEAMVLEICRGMLTDDVVEEIVAAVIRQNNDDQESPELIRIRSDIKATELKINKILDQIENGVNSSRVAERLNERETELEELKRLLKKEEAKQRYIDPEIARGFIETLRGNGRRDPIYDKLLIRTFVDRIYLYDDHIRILMTYSGAQGKADNNKAKEVEKYFLDRGSETFSGSVPNENEQHRCSFFVYYHLFAGLEPERAAPSSEKVQWTFE